MRIGGFREDFFWLSLKKAGIKFDMKFPSINAIVFQTINRVSKFFLTWRLKKRLKFFLIFQNSKKEYLKNCSHTFIYFSLQNNLF